MQTDKEFVLTIYPEAEVVYLRNLTLQHRFAVYAYGYYGAPLLESGQNEDNAWYASRIFIERQIIRKLQE